MSIIFWITSIQSLLLLFYKIILKKNYFSIYSYTIIGIYIPLFLSFVDWSSYHIADRNNYFYYTFICLNLICIIFCFVPQSNITTIKNVQFFKRKRTIPIEVYNIIYIICVLVENAYLSGFLVPSVHGLDVHTGRMPFIYFITTGAYIIVIGDIIEFLSSHKVRYIIYGFIALGINVVTKAARIDAVITFVQVMSFLLFYLFCEDQKKDTKKRIGHFFRRKNNFLFLFLSVIVVYIVVDKIIQVGNDRMNSYGLYDTVYSTGIGYTGPEDHTEILPYYYGYFALSFDNYANNLNLTEADNNYLGLNSFRCFYFGILQFDNLFGLDGGASVRINQIRCLAAAVTTIFWDFYYDYGILLFIPIVTTFLFANLLSKILCKKQNIVLLLLYFFWVPLWMFCSFDNRIYDFQIIWQAIIIFLIYRNRFVMVTDTNKADDNMQIMKKKRIIFVWR